MLKILKKIINLLKTTKSNDEHIEWSGDNICLKRKHYPTMNDDFRHGIGEVKCQKDS